MLKKLLALALATTMMLSMAVTSSAAAATTYDFCTTQLTGLALQMHTSFLTGLKAKKPAITVNITGKKEADVVTAFQQSVQMIIEQHAEIFWLDTSLQNFVTTTDHKSLTFYPRPAAAYGKADANGTKASTISATAIKKDEDALNKIANGITGKTKYALVKGIQDVIISKSAYYAGKEDKQSFHEATGTLLKGTGVCDSYAKAFKYLADKKGLSALVVGGTASNAIGQNGTHAWNYVKLDDGKWYQVDTGWDDPVVVKGGSNAKYNYVYFLKNNVKNDLRKKDAYKYPALAATDYKAA